MDIDNFSRYSSGDLESLIEISPNAEFELCRHDGIKYIKGHNVLRRPDDFAEFLSKFPAEDRNISLQRNEETQIDSSAPGFQQYLKENYFAKLNQKLFKVGYQMKLHRYPIQRVKFDNFTNCCYPGMLAFQKNYLPHTDRFGIAANLYLTDPGTKTSTSFYRIRCSSGNVYHNEFELSKAPKEDALELKARYIDEGANASWEPWVFFRGNDFYDFYYEIPAEYNSVSMYRGNVWHSICYDASPESKVRYSFVTAMFAE